LFYLWEYIKEEGKGLKIKFFIFLDIFYWLWMCMATLLKKWGVKVEEIYLISVKKYYFLTFYSHVKDNFFL